MQKPNNQNTKSNLEQCEKIVKVGDFLSLIVFMVGWYIYDIFFATAALMIVMVPISLAAFAWYRVVPKMQAFMVVLVLLFGSLTLIFHDPTFIKIKPTIMLAGMGIAAFVSVWLKKPIFGMMMSAKSLSSAGVRSEFMQPLLRSLTLRFGCLFMILALLNEVVWRTQTEEFWLYYKVFGSMGLTFLFVFAHIPWLRKNIALLRQQEIAKRKSMFIFPPSED